MQVQYKRKFLKELAKIPSNKVKQIEAFVFDTLPEYENLADTGKVEKMTGYKDCFKVRFGQYRIGLTKINNVITIETIKHRKEIYKFFP